jgi:hypothetical protein
MPGARGYHPVAGTASCRLLHYLGRQPHTPRRPSGPRDPSGHCPLAAARFATGTHPNAIATRGDDVLEVVIMLWERNYVKRFRA